MTKLGKKYERIVADVVQGLDPDAKIDVGTWIDGPDGSREIDVIVNYLDSDNRRQFILECKDYKRKRRIGIEVVDAFASKLNDLNASGAICSNADFTLPARKKAQRLSIGLIGVFSSDGQGSGYEITETFEWRQIKVQNWNVACHFASNMVPDTSDFARVFTPNGNSLLDLGADLLNSGLMKFPVVAGVVNFKCGLEKPIIVSGSRSFVLKSVEATASIDGVWLRKKCQITMDQGLYNWATRRSLGPNGSFSVSVNQLEFDKPELWVSKPMMLEGLFGRREVGTENIGMRMAFMMLDGVPKPKVSELALDRVELIGSIEDHCRSIPKKAYIAKVCRPKKGE